MHLATMPAAPAAAPSPTLRAVPEPDRTPSLSPARRALLSVALTALMGAAEPEPREPEGQTLRPVHGPRGQA